VSQPLVPRILELVYQDSGVRRAHKESLTNWILDTQPRNAPLDPTRLLTYLAAFQPDLLNRLRSDLCLREDLTRALQAVEPN